MTAAKKTSRGPSRRTAGAKSSEGGEEHRVKKGAPSRRPGRTKAKGAAALSEASATAYLHLLKKTLIRVPLTSEDLAMRDRIQGVAAAEVHEIDRWIDICRAGGNAELGDPETRTAGRDWPATAESMIGLFRMDNLHACLLDVLQRGVPGDVIEAGAWRGGATIFMRAVLKAFGERDRRVWVADSFQGLPAPDPSFPADAGDSHWQHAELAVTLDIVKSNFARYGLLDRQVRFVPGWFRDTLPDLQSDALAILRIDADMYESTSQALRSLYPKVSKGGYVIVDDYGALAPCRLAVDEFREEMGIVDPIVTIDWAGAMWKVS